MLNIFWDFDGTIVSTENLGQAELLQEALQRFPHKEDQLQVGKIRGLDSKALYKLLFDVEAEGEHNYPQYLKWYDQKKTLSLENLTPLVIHQSVELIKYFYQKKVKQFVVSNSDVAFIQTALTSLKLEHCFADIYGREMVEHGKPDPELYLLALRANQLEPQNCAVFEDSAVGIRAARGAGISRIMGITDEHTFSSIKALVKNTLDLAEKSWLEKVKNYLGLFDQGYRV